MSDSITPTPASFDQCTGELCGGNTFDPSIVTGGVQIGTMGGNDVVNLSENQQYSWVGDTLRDSCLGVTGLEHDLCYKVGNVSDGLWGNFGSSRPIPTASSWTVQNLNVTMPDSLDLSPYTPEFASEYVPGSVNLSQYGTGPVECGYNLLGNATAGAANWIDYGLRAAGNEISRHSNEITPHGAALFGLTATIFGALSTLKSAKGSWASKFMVVPKVILTAGVGALTVQEILGLYGYWTVPTAEALEINSN